MSDTTSDTNRMTVRDFLLQHYQINFDELNLDQKKELAALFADAAVEVARGDADEERSELHRRLGNSIRLSIVNSLFVFCVGALFANELPLPSRTKALFVVAGAAVVSGLAGMLGSYNIPFKLEKIDTQLLIDINDIRGSEFDQITDDNGGNYLLNSKAVRDNFLRRHYNKGQLIAALKPTPNPA